MNKALLLISLAFISLTATAQYRVVLKSGQTFDCKEKYVLTEEDMVRFQLVSGPEMTMERDQIDWFQTAKINGEKVPSGVKPINQAEPLPSDPPGERDSGPGIVDALVDDFSAIEHEEISFDLLRNWHWFSLLLLGGIWISAFLFNAYLLWGILRILGEFPSFGSVIGWNLAISLFCLGVFWGLTFTEYERIYIMVASWVAFGLLWIFVQIGNLECDVGTSVFASLVFVFLNLAIVLGIRSGIGILV